MRKPRPALAPVHLERLEPSVQALGKSLRLPARLVENEHADGASLAVAHGLESKRLRRGRLLAEGTPNRLERRTRLTPEKRERDVEARDAPPAREVPLRPPEERVDDVLRELKSEEEPE